MTDEFIIKEFKTDNDYINSAKASKKWLNKHSEIKEYLEHRYDPEPFINYGYVLKCIFKGLTELPKCPVCNKILGLHCEDIRKIFCSQKCSANSPDTIKNRFKTNELRYNDPHYHNIEKSKQTRKEKYNDENYTNREKAKQTCLERYKDPYYNNTEKSKQTCLKNWGVDTPFKSKEIREKANQTKIVKYNNPNYTNVEKMKQTKLNKYGNTWGDKDKQKQTCLNLYGVEYYTQSEDFKNKSSKTWKNRTIKEKEITKNKHITTNLSKYDAEWFHQTKEFHIKKHKKYVFNNLFFNSSDELSFYIYYKDKDFNIKQETVKFKYIYRDKEHYYFPDFEIDGKLYEIKGKQFLDEKTGKWKNPYRNPKWTDEEYKEECEKYEAKHQCALQNGVEIVYDCSKYLKYVKNTYGKDFIKSCISLKNIQNN